MNRSNTYIVNYHENGESKKKYISAMTPDGARAIFKARFGKDLWVESVELYIDNN